MDLRWARVEGADLEGGGLYRIRGLASRHLLYIGEAKSLRPRLANHRARWGRIEIDVAKPAGSEVRHRRLEMENDLIGVYYERYRNVPLKQIGAHPGKGRAR